MNQEVLRNDCLQRGPFWFLLAGVVVNKSIEAHHPWVVGFF